MTLYIAKHGFVFKKSKFTRHRAFEKFMIINNFRNSKHDTLLAITEIPTGMEIAL